MTAQKGLALPEGTKVRMTCDYLGFKKGDIVTRVFSGGRGGVFSNVGIRGGGVLFYRRPMGTHRRAKTRMAYPDIGNLTKSDSFRMPKQGDAIQVRERSDRRWIDEAFVAFFDGKAITTPGGDEFNIWNEWRFPEWFEEVTLKNGLTYEVQWNDDDELVLKLK